MAVVLNGTTNDITIDGVSVATDAEVNSAVAPKANTADLKEIGVGQTWQDVTASRVSGTTYTNSTGKPILVSVAGTISVSTNYLAVTINGVISQRSDRCEVATAMVSLQGVIVPTGATYMVTTTAGVFTLQLWTELR